MAITPQRVSAPLSPYRDCYVSLLGAADPTAPTRALCTDAASGQVIGSPPISPSCADSKQDINAEEVIRMIGGTYRLASIAVEIWTGELERQSRRLSGELRLRSRLWRRRRRTSGAR
jgi:hypothetical protein